MNIVKGVLWYFVTKIKKHGFFESQHDPVMSGQHQKWHLGRYTYQIFLGDIFFLFKKISRKKAIPSFFLFENQVCRTKYEYNFLLHSVYFNKYRSAYTLLRILKIGAADGCLYSVEPTNRAYCLKSLCTTSKRTYNDEQKNNVASQSQAGSTYRHNDINGNLMTAKLLYKPQQRHQLQEKRAKQQIIIAHGGPKYVSILIRKHATSSERIQELLDEVHEMVVAGVKPDELTHIYNSIISSQLNLDKNVDKCMPIVEEMKQAEVPLNVHTYSALLVGFVKCRNMNKCTELLNEMKETGVKPNVYTYSILMNGFAKKDMMEECMEWFHNMQKDGIKANVNIYNILIDGFAKKGMTEECKQWFYTMAKDGIKPDVITYTSLISGFAKQEMTKECIQWFEQMKANGLKPDMIFYNILLGVFAKKGMMEECEQWFHKMTADSIKPNAWSYNILLDGFAKKKMTKKCRQHIHKMMYDGIIPNMVTYNIIIALLLKSGHEDVCIKLVSKMKENGITLNDAWMNKLKKKRNL